MLALAEHVSHWSKDPSTQVGAVVYDDNWRCHFGYNGYPSRLPDINLHDRPYKYPRVIHGEINAILNAGISVQGMHLATWPWQSCDECAKFVIAAGIRSVLFPESNVQKERPGFDLALQLFEEAGMPVLQCNLVKE